MSKQFDNSKEMEGINFDKSKDKEEIWKMFSELKNYNDDEDNDYYEEDEDTEDTEENDEDDDFFDDLTEEDLFDEMDDFFDEDEYSERDFYSPLSSKLTPEERERLARDNMNLIHSAISRVMSGSRRNKKENNEDYKTELFSVGLLGYTKAINNYDPDKVTNGRKSKFSTFAFICIYNELRKFLKTDMKHVRNTCSMDHALSMDSSGNSLNISDTLSGSDYGHDSVEEIAEKNYVISVMLKVINEDLKPRDRTIILTRFGINGTYMTQKELGNDTNMSQANISKSQRIILRKIRLIMMKKYKIKNFDF